MPVLLPGMTLSERDIPALRRALKELRDMHLSRVMETDRDKLFFMLVHSALEDFFNSFKLTDHVWIATDESAQNVIGLLTADDARQLLMPVKKTYTGLHRRGPTSLSHQSVGCIGCLMEKAELRSLSPSHTVSEALELMENHDLAYLAVVENNKFQGEVSLSRLAVLLTELLAQSHSDTT